MTIINKTKVHIDYQYLPESWGCATVRLGKVCCYLYLQCLALFIWEMRMIRSIAFAVAVMFCSAGMAIGMAHAASEAERAAVTKVYEKYASGFNESDAEKMWAVVDSKCVFIDENGNREFVDTMLPKTKEFLSGIRNNNITYSINDVKNKNGKLIVYVNSEARFELHSKMLFVDDWEPKVRSTSVVDTWEKRGGSWKLVESRSLRPEDLREMDTASTGESSGKVKPVKFAKQSACVRKCTDALISCTTASREEDTAASAKCVGENASCMSGCRQ